MKEVFIFLFMCDFLKWLKIYYGDILRLNNSFKGTLYVVGRYERNWKICIMCNVQSFIKIRILHAHSSCKLYINDSSDFLVLIEYTTLPPAPIVNTHNRSVALDRFDMNKQCLVVSIIFVCKVKNMRLLLVSIIN